MPWAIPVSSLLTSCDRTVPFKTHRAQNNSPPNPCHLLFSFLSVLCLSDCLQVQDVDTDWSSTYPPAICLYFWCLSKGIQAASAQQEGVLPRTHTSTGPLWLKTHFCIDVYSLWNVSGIQCGDSLTLPRRHSRKCEPNLGYILFCKTFKLAGPGSQSPRPGPTAT